MDKAVIPPFNPYMDPNKVCLEWISWKRNFALYLMAKGVTKDQEKVAMLLFWAGPEVQRMYMQKKCGETEESDSDNIGEEYPEAIKLLDSVFLNQKNKSFQRATFRQMTQGKEESILSFVGRLREQAKFCEFGTESATDQAIQDQILEKGSSEKLRRELWKKERKLPEVIKLAQSLENASMYEKNHALKEGVDVNWVAGSSDGKRFKTEKGHENPKETFRGRCWSCNGMGHRKGDLKCVARDKKCLKCGRKGHFSVSCRQNRATRFKKSGNRMGNIRAIESDEEDGEEYCGEYVLSLDDEKTGKTSCKIGGVFIKMIIDSGTRRNLIPEKVWKEMKSGNVKVKEEKVGSDITLKAYGQNSTIPIRGRFLAELELNGKTSDQWFYIVQQGDSCLLGAESSKEHDVLRTGAEVNFVGTKNFPKIKGNTFMSQW